MNGKSWSVKSELVHNFVRVLLVPQSITHFHANTNAGCQWPHYFRLPFHIPTYHSALSIETLTVRIGSRHPVLLCTQPLPSLQNSCIPTSKRIKKKIEEKSMHRVSIKRINSTIFADATTITSFASHTLHDLVVVATHSHSIHRLAALFAIYNLCHATNTRFAAARRSISRPFSHVEDACALASECTLLRVLSVIM